jgi:lysophospholipase L1-like esterase
MMVAAGAGFGVGSAVLADGRDPTPPDVVVAAAEPAPPSETTLPSEAPIAAPDEPISGEPQLIAEDPGRDAVDLSGPASADDEWPVDTRGDGCSTPLWPQVSADTPRVLVIGDSLIRESRGDLESGLAADGWAPTVRCWGAKGSLWGVQQVERARQLDQLPDTVVVSLGTNDIWWLGVPMEQAVTSMMDALGPDVTVYWVNLWFGPHNYDRLPEAAPANQILGDLAGQYPNLRIIDFAGDFEEARAAGIGVGWLDGVHLNDMGNRVRTESILRALSEHLDAADGTDLRAANLPGVA